MYANIYIQFKLLEIILRIKNIYIFIYPTTISYAIINLHLNNVLLIFEYKMHNDYI